MVYQTVRVRQDVCLSLIDPRPAAAAIEASMQRYSQEIPPRLSTVSLIVP